MSHREVLIPAISRSIDQASTFWLPITVAEASPFFLCARTAVWVKPRALSNIPDQVRIGKDKRGRTRIGSVLRLTTALQCPQISYPPTSCVTLQRGERVNLGQRTPGPPG